MSTAQRPHLPDIRTILGIYAALTGLGGMIVVAWGPMFFGTNMPGLPFGKAALVRVFGAVLVATGCWAGALSQIGDPALRRKGLLWFAAGHFTVLLVLHVQRVAIWGPGLATGIENYLSTAFFAVLAMVGYGEGLFTDMRRSDLTSGTWSTDPLRSRYEQEIRQAGAQEERNRLARDLHDSIKQQIFIIQTAAATAQARFDTDHSGAALAIDQIRDSARDAMREMEVMMDQLRSAPLENGSLIENLRKQCEALGSSNGSSGGVPARRSAFKPAA